MNVDGAGAPGGGSDGCGTKARRVVQCLTGTEDRQLSWWTPPRSASSQLETKKKLEEEEEEELQRKRGELIALLDVPREPRTPAQQGSDAYRVGQEEEEESAQISLSPLFNPSRPPINTWTFFSSLLAVLSCV